MKGVGRTVIKALEESIETRANEFEECVRELEVLIKKYERICGFFNCRIE